MLVIIGVFGYLYFSTTYPVPANIQSTANSTVCSISGQPGPFFFRFMSTSNRTGFVPIVGAQVKATNRPAYCGSSPATQQTTLTFTTNGTMWYSLDSLNNAGYSIVVTYSGQNYNLTADIRPVSVTCASLYWPTGQSNITITAFQTTCSSSTSSSTEGTSANHSGLYNVTFQQVGVGACPFLGEPWAVTIGNITKVQPLGTPLPLNDGGPLMGTNNASISLISFLLPMGSYQYQVHPAFEFFTPSSGTVNINGTAPSVVVEVAYTGHGCTSTTSSK